MRHALDLDLPLEETPAGKLLLGITASLIYLAVLAFAVAALADGKLRSLQRQPQLVTVVLPAAEGRAGAAEEEAAVLDMLVRFQGVAHAAMLGEDEMAALVEPLVGEERAVADLAMPRLLDVTFNPGPLPDLPALEQALHALVPDASVVPADPRAGDDETVIRLYRSGGLAIGSVFLLVTIISVAVVTRLSLDMHGETVDLLRTMGAPDGYVARQFEHFALSRGLRGALFGFFGGCLTLAAVVHLLPLLTVVALPTLTARPIDWLLLALVPILAAFLITVCARLTAMWGLTSSR